MDVINFIRLNKIVTAEQAGLVAADILPAKVNGSILYAKEGNYIGWEIAVTVRDALLNNVITPSTPEPVSITYWDRNSWSKKDETSYFGLVDIIPAVIKRGKPDCASFEAATLWPWIIDNISGFDLSFDLFCYVKEIQDPTANSPTPPICSPDYLNPSHPRYSHKLAAAIAVWNAMEDENLLRGVSTKTAMSNWLTANQKESGIELSKTGITEVVTVANWSTKGGAPKTPQPK